MLQFPDSGGGWTTVPLDGPASHANAPLPGEGYDKEPTPESAGGDPPIKVEAEAEVVPDSDEELPSSQPYTLDDDEPEAKMKPRVHVTYAGFKVYSRELVLILEPSEAAVAAAPELFEVEDDAVAGEHRQLFSTARVNFHTDASREFGRARRVPTRAETPLFRGLSPEP